MQSNDKITLQAKARGFSRYNGIVILNLAYFISLLLGTSFYIGSTALSFQNILLVPTFLANILTFSRLKIGVSLIKPLFFLSLFIIYLLIVLPATPDIGNNWKYFFYELHILTIYLSALSIPTDLYPKLATYVKKGLLLWLILALLQLGVITSILPSSFSFLFFRSARAETSAIMQINGTFANSNDFGCVIFLLFLFVVFVCGTKTTRLYEWVTLAISLLAMSRTVVVLLVALEMCKKWINGQGLKALKYVFWGGGVIIVLILTVDTWKKPLYDTLYSNFGYNAVTINFQRITSILEVEDFSKEEDTSSSYRTSTYKYALGKLPFHFKGTGAQDYGSFYKDGGFRNKLVWTNPHSYLIEIGIAFGVIGLLLFVCFLVAVFIGIMKLRDTRARRFLLFIFICSVILSNIPAACVQIPLLWLPLIFTFVYARRMQYCTTN